MKLEQLRQAAAVGRAGSINAAAKLLYTAQSTLSASIRALEQELGQPIFVRSPSGIRPTEFGTALLRRAEEMLRLEAEIREDAALQSGGSPLRIGAYHLLFASRLFGEFCAAHGSMSADLCFLEESRTNLIEAVSDGQLELAVLTMPDLHHDQWLDRLEDQGLSYTRLTEEALYAFCGPGCGLYESERSSIPTDQLSAFPLIYFPERDPLFDSLNRGLGLPCRGSIAVSGRGALQSVYQETGGIYLGVYNENAYRNRPYYPNTRRFLLENAPCTMELGTVTRRQQPLSPLTRQYLADLRRLLGLAP